MAKKLIVIFVTAFGIGALAGTLKHLILDNRN